MEQSSFKPPIVTVKHFTVFYRELFLLCSASIDTLFVVNVPGVFWDEWEPPVATAARMSFCSHLIELKIQMSPRSPNEPSSHFHPCSNLHFNTWMSYSQRRVNMTPLVFPWFLLKWRGCWKQGVVFPGLLWSVVVLKVILKTHGLYERKVYFLTMKGPVFFDSWTRKILPTRKRERKEPHSSRYTTLLSHDIIQCWLIPNQF